MKKNQVVKKLSSLIGDFDNWEHIQMYFGNGKNPIKPDQLLVSFVKRLTADLNPNYIRIRIGGGIIESLGWQHADKILPMFNKDDESIFLLVKPDSNVGFKLAKENKGHAYALNFKWTGTSTLPGRDMSMVKEHEISKNKLIFQV